MISRFIYTLKFIQYKLSAKHKKGHGIHSPFMYDLIRFVFRNKKINDDLRKIINIHKQYKKSELIINYKEIGAGSKYTHKKSQKIGEIIKKSSITIKHGKLIYDLIRYFEPTSILELGSSVGVSSMYISQAAFNSHFTSIEGIQEKLEVAKKISLDLKQNTEFICGDFDAVLDSVVENYDKLDFVFFDGNHKKQSTIKYFETCLNKIHNNSVFIFDDIHWSKEMEEAWNYIINHRNVKVSVDLFRMGLIFFKQELSYEKYVIKF